MENLDEFQWGRIWRRPAVVEGGVGHGGSEGELEAERVTDQRRGAILTLFTDSRSRRHAHECGRRRGAQTDRGEEVNGTSSDEEGRKVTFFPCSLF